MTVNLFFLFFSFVFTLLFLVLVLSTYTSCFVNVFFCYTHGQSTVVVPNTASVLSLGEFVTLADVSNSNSIWSFSRQSLYNRKMIWFGSGRLVIFHDMGTEPLN